MAENADAPPVIIIKRIKKGGHGGHHGGAWKVAYADFVTAMMAFFLLMWLLNSTTDSQKRGIADYFSPASISKSYSGSGGTMGGTSLETEGAMRSAATSTSVTIVVADSEDESGEDSEAKSGKAESGAGAEQRRILAQREAARFSEAESSLRQAVQAAPVLRALADAMIIERTEEGLQIQVVDQAGQPLFPKGSAEMYDTARQLFALVAKTILSLPNQIAIKGHTDAAPYVASNGYSNWELSSDRANASRRALIDAGVPAGRFVSVSGRADQDPLEPHDPFSPRNRRITVVLLREAPIPLGANSGLKPRNPPE